MSSDLERRCLPQDKLPREAQQFMVQIEPLRTPNTCRAYRLALRRFYQWLYDQRLTIGRLQRRHLIAWSTHMQQQGLAPATRQLTMVVIRLYLDHLASLGRLKRAPQALLTARDLPKLAETLPRALSPEHDRRLCALFAGKPHPAYLGFLLMRHTGIRIGELTTLHYHCIRKDSSTRSYLRVPVGKLNSERLVPLSDDAVRVIQKLQRLGIPGRSRLLASRGRRQFTDAGLRIIFAAAVAELALSDDKPIIPHRLRHSYATSMLNSGMSIGVLKEILGHRDVNMTLRYARPTRELLSSEYNAAIVMLQKRYDLHTNEQEPGHGSDRAAGALDALVRIVERNAAARPQDLQVQARNFVKRLKRIGDALNKLRL